MDADRRAGTLMFDVTRERRGLGGPEPAVEQDAAGPHVRIDQDIADIKRLIHYLELRAYDAARRARSAGANASAATAEALLHKLRTALNEANQLRQSAALSRHPNWAI